MFVFVLILLPLGLVHWSFLILSMIGLVCLIAFGSELSPEEKKEFDRIREILWQRKEFPRELWGERARADLAQAIAKMIAEEIGWPHGYFMPEDLLKVVFWAPRGDGGEGLAVRDELEKRLHIRMRGIQDWGRTFGEFVDRCSGSMIPSQGSAPGPEGEEARERTVGG
jgi:hypothetical protein